MFDKIDMSNSWWSGWRWGFVQGALSFWVLAFAIGVIKGLWILAGS